MNPGRSFLFFLFIFLSACAAPLPRPPDAALERLWQAHATALAPLAHWDLRGRLAVRSGERGGQATFSWQRAATHHAISLYGPFGRGVLRVVQNDQGAQLVDAEGRSYQAVDAEQLLALYTGWQLPLAHLDRWLLGLPLPEPDAQRELDSSGRLAILRQAGWEIRYQAYTRVDRIDLPSRLTLTRAASAGRPALEARFVIDRWAQVR